MSNNRIGTWQLIKLSWQILSANKKVFWLPIISFLSSLLVLILVCVVSLPVILMATQSQQHLSTQANTIISWVLLAVCYFILFTITIFFNTALLAFIRQQLETQDATVKSAIAFAYSRLGKIIGWSLVSATVGIILRVIAEKFELVGKIIEVVLGCMWSIASYFVLPIIIYDNIGPIDALKKSAQLFRDTWGQRLKLTVGFGLLMVVLFFVPLLVMSALGGLLAGMLSDTAQPILISIIATIIVAWFIFFITVQNILKAVLQSLLYRFASGRSLPNFVSTEQMQATVAVRTKRWWQKP